MLCASMVALLPACLALAIAAAQPSVAVLGPADGPGSAARQNMEAAIRARGDVEVVDYQRWVEAARAAGLSGFRTWTVGSVPKVAPSLKADAALVVSPEPPA